MTTKTAAPRPAELRETLTDDLKIAHQVHTLAQMLYGRLAAVPPWTPMAQAPYPPVLH